MGEIRFYYKDNAGISLLQDIIMTNDCEEMTVMKSIQTTIPIPKKWKKYCWAVNKALDIKEHEFLSHAEQLVLCAALEEHFPEGYVPSVSRPQRIKIIIYTDAWCRNLRMYKKLKQLMEEQGRMREAIYRWFGWGKPQ